MSLVCISVRIIQPYRRTAWMAAPALLFRDHAGSGHHLVSGVHDIGQIKHPSKAVCVREPVQMAFGVNLDVKVTGNLPDFVGLGSS